MAAQSASKACACLFEILLQDGVKRGKTMCGKQFWISDTKMQPRIFSLLMTIDAVS